MSDPAQSGIVRGPDPVGNEGRAERTLGRLATAAADIEGLWKRDLKPGDWVVIDTRNSTYTLAVQEDLSVVVTGGWFGSSPEGPTRLRVAGCTWGGSAILLGMLAAPGMCVEFSNGVRTTRVKAVRVMRHAAGSVH